MSFGLSDIVVVLFMFSSEEVCGGHALLHRRHKEGTTPGLQANHNYYRNFHHKVKLGLRTLQDHPPKRTLNLLHPRHLRTRLISSRPSRSHFTTISTNHLFPTIHTMSDTRTYDIKAIHAVMARISEMSWSDDELDALKLHLVPLVDTMDCLQAPFLLQHLEKLESCFIFHFNANPTVGERTKCIVDCLVDFRCETHRLLTGVSLVPQLEAVSMI